MPETIIKQCATSYCTNTSMFNQPSTMVWKNCTECGRNFHGIPEVPLCLDCWYRHEDPQQNYVYWMWGKEGRPTWGIKTHWPDGEPLPNTGDQVTVHRKDGSTSVVKIEDVERPRRLSNGKARLHCTIKRDVRKTKQSKRGGKIPKTIIRKCANSYCKDAFEVENEDDQQIICEQCEIEIVAQTPTPDLGSEFSEFRETEQGQLWAPARKGPRMPEGPRIPEGPHIPKDMRMVLKSVQRARAANKGPHAPGTGAIRNISQGKIPDNLPKEVLGAAQDLAGFLTGRIVPPKTNRLGAPHASGWEIEHIMHLIWDLAKTMNKTGEEMLPEVQIEVLRELLRTAIDITLLTKHRINPS